MARRVRITADKLGEEIGKILEEYGGDVEHNLDEITKKVAQKGRSALRNESKAKFGGTGKYAGGWTVTPVKYPHYTSVVIHNKLAGLPHLLEHGHVLILGGRKVGTVDGREHIAPVEEELIEQYQREVLNAL